MTVDEDRVEIQRVKKVGQLAIEMDGQTNGKSSPSDGPGSGRVI
jgi:hypothetical protein